MILLLLSAAVSSAAMQPAATADLTDSNRAQNEATADREPTADTAYAMIDCLWDDHHDRMEAVLGRIPGSQSALRPFVTIPTRRCTNVNETIEATTFYSRGAIAERLLYRDFEAIGRPRGRPVAVFSPVSSYYLQNADRYSRLALGMLDMAGCVVRAEPQRSYAFFRTERNSVAEHRALAELGPALAACLPEGQNARLKAPVVRAFLAEAVYRAAVGRPQVFASQ